MSTPFAETLRTATRQAHQTAHDSPYMSGLLGGSLPLSAFAQLVTQHYFIYTALEQAAEANRDHPVAGPFVHDGLNRVPALERDLAHLIGPDWRDTVTPHPATVTYTDRIRSASGTPTGFVAHHYTRYLGDLAGGQVTKAKMRQYHGLTDDGVHFYDFTGLGSPAKFRERYRSLLNSAPWSPEDHKQVIVETLYAFELNTAVFTELDGTLSSVA
ncbi:heme oxygenase (biliverdin-producing) [Actinocrispum wychmicini]|uniref:Heme oxygenase n=1 Tax=Actinocrispum wychmicini TaxID=1213861 RepID=A0A4R2JEN7_9PSEU|nr:biliverdin-producing heme oxygenase [Actinocrispum wychmicini]TCO58151.1 heme oxygenase [Actinocrispum wychmicini]